MAQVSAHTRLGDAAMDDREWTRLYHRLKERTAACLRAGRSDRWLLTQKEAEAYSRWLSATAERWPGLAVMMARTWITGFLRFFLATRPACWPTAGLLRSAAAGSRRQVRT